MRKVIKYYLMVSVIVSATVYFGACTTEEPECYEPKNVTAFSQYAYRSSDSIDRPVIIGGDTIIIRELDTTYRDTFLPISLFRVVNEDSVFQFMGVESNIGGFYLNAAKDSIQYLFTPDTSLVNVFDTLTLHYTPLLHFISNNCGYNYYFNINEVQSTKRFVDSIFIVNNSVTNDINTRNLKLILKR